MDELMPAEEREALLSRELDAWLRGDHSRRHVLAGLLGVAATVGGTLLPTGAEAASRPTWAGRHRDAALRLAAVELASPDTPLGKAQADAVAASTKGPADGSAYRAVAAAKGKAKGAPLALTYEAGLQALEPRNFSGPLWQQLTGIALQRRRAAASRPVFQADRRAHRASPAPTTSSTSSRHGFPRSPTAASSRRSTTTSAST